MKYSLLLCTGMIAAVGCLNFSHAASFLCDKAKTPTEKAICQTRSLNDADVKMVTTYNIVIHALPMGGVMRKKGRSISG